MSRRATLITESAAASAIASGAAIAATTAAIRAMGFGMVHLGMQRDDACMVVAKTYLRLDLRQIFVLEERSRGNSCYHRASLW
jgi:hypothetical protein